VKRAAAFLFVLVWCCCVPAFAAAAGAPAIQYSTPSPIRNHEATLRFAIDPEGLETSYEVMYGKVGESYRPLHEPLDGVLPAGDDPVALAKQLPVFFEGALQAGTEYHWRVVAKNTAGETVGGDQVFTTTNGPKPVFVNGSATQTGPDAMRFTATVNPEGAPVTGCRFRWVDAETFHYAGFEKAEGEGVARFGRTVPCEESSAEIGSGTKPVAVHAEADEIDPGEYFFRLEGENAYEDATAFGGTSFELVEGVPPSIEYSEPDPIRNHEATLRFSIDPGGLETTYDLEWARAGEEFTDWGMHGGVPAGEGGPVAQEVKVPRYWEGGLAAGKEFHWRVRAWNAFGETVGSEQFFTTTNGPNPEVANGTATQTGEGTVELTATVDPEGVPLTECEFRYLDFAGYYHGFDWHDAIEQIRIGPTVPCEESPEEIGSGTEPVTVHAELTGLHPGEWFFRVEADNQYESSPLLAGTSFEVVAPFPPPAVTGPSVPPGVDPPGIDKAPGLGTAPGLSKAPGLKKARKKHAKRLRRNATIAAPLGRFKQRQR
jgi:hypothetical protein